MQLKFWESTDSWNIVKSIGGTNQLRLPRKGVCLSLFILFPFCFLATLKRRIRWDPRRILRGHLVLPSPFVQLLF